MHFTKIKTTGDDSNKKLPSRCFSKTEQTSPFILTGVPTVLQTRMSGLLSVLTHVFKRQQDKNDHQSTKHFWQKSSSQNPSNEVLEHQDF